MDKSPTRLVLAHWYLYAMFSRSVRPRLAGFIEPCLSSPAPKPPAASGWIHEIKHDGFRLMALKAPVRDKTRGDAIGVRLFTRRGLDWTDRYPSIAAAVAALSCRSCLIDGEVVICDEDGIPVFDRLRYGRQPQTEAVLFAFDLLELGGKDLRSAPLEGRKRVLAKLLRKAGWALHFNDHIDEPGDVVFRHACKLGFEGIVSKRLGSPYRSGRSRHWVKSKNPAARREPVGGGGLGALVLADWAAAISSFPTDYPRLTGWFSSVVSAGVLLTTLLSHWKRPIIKVELGGARSHGRVPLRLTDPQGKTIETPVKYFRLRITNAGLTTIKDCSGQLLKLTRRIAGKEPECFDTDSYVFGWAHNDKSDKQDISRRQSFLMDLATLSLSSGRRGQSQLFFGGLGRPMSTTLAAFLNSYSGKATYRYDLLISADNARPRTVSVEFEFDPKRDSLKFIPFNTRYFGWRIRWWLRSLSSRRR